ncbi:hypothetical protein IA539_04565 [Gordonia sp. zg691]|uniref:EthD family reductase n=1 Tax=Gordonia jinghuaiqii TaxID=2758710 RepID=A0A7D7QGD7_9ACTN|nr:DUF4286 family protein [Gordonia jinghuaiqii]MBD0860481.1 hypothetical protein [Gordonia jinghuaiqii]MCR5978250.1 hypothetical protein [Gordonia jinghuaiqii]QMT01302.1 hypothetical protein H1R19_21125 [Gordonia jinghuaiqii]
MSASALLLAYVQPTSPADEPEFNRWYDEVHIPQLIERVPGVRGARRYHVADAQFAGAPAPANSYLTVYEIDSENIADTVAEINTAMSDGSLELTTTLDGEVSPPVMHVFQPA